MATTRSDNESWLVAVDLGGRSRGALVCASWLRTAAALPLVAVHVLETWVRALGVVDPTEVIRTSVVREVGLVDAALCDGFEVREAGSAEDALTEAAATAGGLILGRAAPAGERPRVRLGRVARRLLRRLPGPVIVVPPDLREIAEGPVLLATDLGPASEEATWFARRLALRCDRPLELVHVGEDRHGDLIDELQPSWLAAREQHHAATEAAALAWVEKHRLTDAVCHVIHGDAVEVLVAAAAARKAALVVVGSRRLSTAARLFVSSTASTLAGVAECPICVVPSEST